MCASTDRQNFNHCYRLDLNIINRVLFILFPLLKSQLIVYLRLDRNAYSTFVIYTRPISCNLFHHVKYIKKTEFYAHSFVSKVLRLNVNENPYGALSMK